MTAAAIFETLDLFPGFEARHVTLGEDASSVDTVFLRIAGPESAPPLLLLHGFPQTGAMWARVATILAAQNRWRVIVPDLPGYGASALEEGRSSPERMSKRRLAADMVALMTALGHERFDLAGHDRGGRVAYRLAFDHGERLGRVATLDITPTLDYWERCADRGFNTGVYHWTFLAQPRPIPETLIGGAPEWYLDGLIASWTAAKGLSAFEPTALTAYRENMRRPDILQAMCDDYRAGATLDAEADEADRAAGRMIDTPLLALWGGSGIARKASSPETVWKRWAREVVSEPIACGHFMPEERPEETAAAMIAFFGG